MAELPTFGPTYRRYACGVMYSNALLAAIKTSAKVKYLTKSVNYRLSIPAKLRTQHRMFVY